MFGKDFVSTLKAIKREVLAMKQAHLRGLGAVNFYSKTHQELFLANYVGSPVNIVIEFDESVSRPFCQVYLDRPYLLTQTGTEWSEENHTLTVRQLSNVSGVTLNINAYVIATAPVISISVNGDWF